MKNKFTFILFIIFFLFLFATVYFYFSFYEKEKCKNNSLNVEIYEQEVSIYNLKNKTEQMEKYLKENQDNNQDELEEYKLWEEKNKEIQSYL